MTTMAPLALEMLAGELVRCLGPDHVRRSQEDRLAVAHDYFWVPRMLIDRGLTPPLPDLVVSPGSASEVQAVVALARQHRIPVIPFGGGSGSQGGIMPIHGGITVDLKRLNRIIAIDTTAGTVTAEAGVNGWVLESALNAEGWTLPHYPASVHCSTLGGYLACRGSGTVSTKYGKAEDLVLTMDVVLPDATLMSTLPVPNHAAGPGTLQLFVGAEGSFGIITRATMRIERLPEVRRFRALLFPDLDAGMEAGRRIMLDRLQPCVMRLYDEASTVRTVRHVLGHDVSGGAWMVLGFDGYADIAAAQEARALAHCRDLGGDDHGEAPGRHWWDHRYDFYFPPKVPEFPWMIGTLDTVAPFGRILPLYRAKKARLERDFAAHGLIYYAHFSHWFPWGAMVYDRFVIERPPTDPAGALALHDAVWDAATDESLAHGGVINEHHGVGLKLARHVRRQYGAGFAVIEAIKDRLDPDNLMNPGKMGFGPPRGGRA